MFFFEIVFVLFVNMSGYRISHLNIFVLKLTVNSYDLFLFNEGIYVARYMKGVTVKWFVIHVVFQSIGVAAVLAGISKNEMCKLVEMIK